MSNCPRRHAIRGNRERGCTQADRGPSASRLVGSYTQHRLDPVAGGERAHRTGVREGRAQRISTGRASAHNIHVDDLPWWWADASDINTIDLAGMPPGPHKLRIELVNANHEVFPGQSKTVTFTIPKK